MSVPRNLQSPEHLICCICLDVFTNPVSTPCGHHFCMACIAEYWSQSDVRQCPLCKMSYPVRPDLHVNKTLEESARDVKETSPCQAEGCFARPGEVPCAACTGEKLKAVKSCLVCLKSFCETHVQPHYQTADFEKHQLIDLVKNLDDKMCKQHGRRLEKFCVSDQTCICTMCTEADHWSHKIVPASRESKKKKPQLEKTMAEVQQMIQDRLRKVQEIRQSVKLSKGHTRSEIEDSKQVFSDLAHISERSQAELTKAIEEKQRAAERQAEGLIEELEQEITKLGMRRNELEQLLQTKDHIHFLQRFPSLCIPPHTRDWSEITVHTNAALGTVGRAVSWLEESKQEEAERLSEAVDVILDARTAHPDLNLSKDGKMVNHAAEKGMVWQGGEE